MPRRGQEQSVNKGRAFKRVPKASPPPPKTSKTSKPQFRKGARYTCPHFSEGWPSMQLGGGATSCWHFDGGFIGGGEAGPTKPQGDPKTGGRAGWPAGHRARLGVSLQPTRAGAAPWGR